MCIRDRPYLLYFNIDCLLLKVIVFCNHIPLFYLTQLFNLFAKQANDRDGGMHAIVPIISYHNNPLLYSFHKRIVRRAAKKVIS